MATPVDDPYATLGVSPGVSDAELRAAYRRLVQLHHPDHNGGSPESEQRFEEVQAAYSRIRELRASGRPAGGAGRSSGARPDAGGRSSGAPPHAGSTSRVETRLAEMEMELRAARAAREQARRAAEQAAREASAEAARASRDASGDAARRGSGGQGDDRPSDEQLGYYSTDDSFTKILSDAASQFAERVSDVADHHVPKRLSDLIDELGSKLTGEPPER